MLQSGMFCHVLEALIISEKAINNGDEELVVEYFQMGYRWSNVAVELKTSGLPESFHYGCNQHMIQFRVPKTVENTESAGSNFGWAICASLLDENRSANVHVVIAKAVRLGSGKFSGFGGATISH
jgi:hypothetical protein